MLMSVHQLSKRYGEKVCFNKISFAIEDHDKMGLIGRNGCGKTTLMRILAGLDQCDEGEIIRKNGLRVRMCMQDQFFDDSKTIFETVKASFVLAKENYEAETILTKLGFDDLHRPVKGLSGGEKKRLALACALCEPCIFYFWMSRLIIWIL